MPARRQPRRGRRRCRPPARCLRPAGTGRADQGLLGARPDPVARRRPAGVRRTDRVLCRRAGLEPSRSSSPTINSPTSGFRLTWISTDSGCQGGIAFTVRSFVMASAQTPDFSQRRACVCGVFEPTPYRSARSSKRSPETAFSSSASTIVRRSTVDREPPIKGSIRSHASSGQNRKVLALLDEPFSNRAGDARASRGAPDNSGAKAHHVQRLCLLCGLDVLQFLPRRLRKALQLLQTPARLGGPLSAGLPPPGAVSPSPRVPLREAVSPG